MACINFFSLAEVQLSLSASKLADGALQWLLFTFNEKGLAVDSENLVKYCGKAWLGILL